MYYYTGMDNEFGHQLYDFICEGGSVSDVHVTSNVELRNNVRLLLNVELRNYVISRQIVEGRVTSDCYLNIVVSLDC